MRFVHCMGQGTEDVVVLKPRSATDGATFHDGAGQMEESTSEEERNESGSGNQQSGAVCSISCSLTEVLRLFSLIY